MQATLQIAHALDGHPLRATHLDPPTRVRVVPMGRDEKASLEGTTTRRHLLRGGKGPLPSRGAEQQEAHIAENVMATRNAAEEHLLRAAQVTRLAWLAEPFRTHPGSGCMQSVLWLWPIDQSLLMPGRVLRLRPAANRFEFHKLNALSAVRRLALAAVRLSFPATPHCRHHRRSHRCRGRCCHHIRHLLTVRGETG